VRSRCLTVVPLAALRSIGGGIKFLIALSTHVVTDIRVLIVRFAFLRRAALYKKLLASQLGSLLGLRAHGEKSDA
jgi:hypothetical protein